MSAEEIDEVILVGGMTRMPKIIEKVSDFLKEPHRGVNPDEVVASETNTRWSSYWRWNVLLLDVTPLSLGIEI